MAILPVHGRPFAPCDLAFTGPKGDYWGAWKTRVPAKGLSQDDQRRYLNVGVTSASPSHETSRAFFEWLSAQDVEVLKQHISCAHRHILHRNGPEAWAFTFADVPFIPSRNHKGLRFVSRQTALYRPVYLPDVKEIAEQVIESDPTVLLAVDRVQEVAEPISETLRRLGVRSLREVIGEPEQVVGNGEVLAVTEKLQERLDALRSRKFRQTILKRLAELGIERELIRHDWYDRLTRIGSIRFAENVEGRYRFRGKLYGIATDAGFDPPSGVFWIKAGDRLRLTIFYEAIAGQLVFKPIARPVDLLALERAVELEVRDPSFGRPETSSAYEQEEQEVGVDQANGDAAEPGEALFGHAPFQPDPSRNVPKPEPIPLSLSTTSKQRQGQYSSNAKNKTDHAESHTPELEREQIESLKRQHYASHCQICLSNRLATELAPAGSYVEWEEVRRRVIEAHHLDLKSGGGARHAGNLIVLCKLHHDNYGRRLTRETVTAALRKKANEKAVRFKSVDGSVSEIKGRVIDVVIPDIGDIISIFFTDEHASYWLSNAFPPAQIVDSVA